MRGVTRHTEFVRELLERVAAYPDANNAERAALLRAAATLIELEPERVTLGPAVPPHG